MPRDIIVDDVTHDLKIDGDLSLNERTDYVKQKLKIRLWFFYQEWFLDTSLGVPYIQTIMGKNPDISQIEAIFKREILGTPFVNEIESFDLTLNPGGRRLNLEFTVLTDFGRIVMEFEQ